ncbi:Short chain dehydrogenase [Lachnellula subtilissima]|uniref:Short chain dehydrogenase n=1 Tax=Lachnellula subtilissima TaxID=602034 RepID=A0A8H8RNK2_9HELO|nr:Short chain dehydrogenase [Lachnellula subtilissima]
MQPPFPSITPTWHNDVYPAIDPSNSELSQAGKTIVITGAGSGIGRATAVAFAKAGAKRIILIGRTESNLIETQRLLESQTCASEVFVCSITDEAAVKQAASSIGSWDVLVMNAGHASPGYVITSTLADYWQNYETNVKSVVVLSQAFFPNANPSGAAIYALTSGALALPTKLTAGLSAYLSSKAAQAKIMEYLAVENPNHFVCTIHPGMIETKVFQATGAKAEQLPMDTVDLPAHFLVWLSQPKTKFLNGKLVWSNWDVEELCAQSEKIENSTMLTIGYEGWPFAA